MYGYMGETSGRGDGGLWAWRWPRLGGATGSLWPDAGGRALIGRLGCGPRRGCGRRAGAWSTRSGGAEAPAAGHVVSEREPQGHRLGLGQAADGEADQAAVPRLGVGAFGGGGAQPIDRLGRVGAHAPAPGRDRRRVVGQRRVRGRALAVARLGRRREDLAARLFQPLDVGELGVAAVGQMLRRAGGRKARPAGRSSARACPGRCRGVELDRRDQPALGVGGQLHVERRADSRRRPSSSPAPRDRWSRRAAPWSRRGVPSRPLFGARAARCRPSASAAASARSTRSCRSRAARSRAPACRRLAARRVGVELGAQLGHPCRRRLAAALQGRAAPERGRTGRGPHPHAVLRHPLQAGDPRPQQRREAVGQQALEQRAVRHPEVAQRSCGSCRRRRTATGRRVLAAQPRQLAGAADALDRGVQPQRHQQPWLGRRMPGMALDRPDPRRRAGPDPAARRTPRPAAPDARPAPAGPGSPPAARPAAAPASRSRGTPPPTPGRRRRLLRQRPEQSSRRLVGHEQLHRSPAMTKPPRRANHHPQHPVRAGYIHRL